MSYTYEYPRPAVTVDIMVFDREEPQNLLLIQRKNPPFQGLWAFPGGFVDPDETLEMAAKRELEEETGISINHLEQFKTFSEPDRDPRGRTISTIFFAAIEKKATVTAGDDAAKASWFKINELPQLGFDHQKIIMEAKNKNIFKKEANK